MKVSTRFAVPVLALLSAALVPVVIYSTVTPSVDDCSQPERLLQVSEITSTTRVETRMPAGGRLWTIDRRDLLQRIQGYAGSHGDSSALEFAIIRVYGLPETFLSPAHTLSRRFEVNSRSFEWLDAGSDHIPVYIETQRERFVAYFFVYRARPVKNPFLARLSGALRELANGRQPLTSIMIAGTSPEESSGGLPQDARSWLAAAWHHYRRACSP